MIKSISYDQSEIIRDIIRLHCPTGIDCDPTFSSGNFYKNTGIDNPKYCYDIEPKTPEVLRADCRSLPLPDESIRCLMFDPPFLATTGKSLHIDDDSNIINKRFGVYDSEILLHRMYIDALVEFQRVLISDGVLIFKCQDKVSSGKQYFSHCFVQQAAIDAGFYPVDLFILLSKNRIVADWQLKNQKHARKFHSYFWVFRKSNKKTIYV